MFLLEGTKVLTQLAGLSALCRPATLTCEPRDPCATPIAAGPGGLMVGEGKALPGERARAGAEKGRGLFWERA